MMIQIPEHAPDVHLIAINAQDPRTPVVVARRRSRWRYAVEVTTAGVMRTEWAGLGSARAHRAFARVAARVLR